MSQQQTLARFGSLTGLQRMLGNQAMLTRLNSPRIQTKSSTGAGDEFEAEADRAAELVVQRTRAPGLQRKCADGDSCACAKCSGVDEQERFSSTPARIQRQAKDGKQPAGESASEARHRQLRSLIVDDEAPSIAPGQMRKSAFLAQLRRVVCLTVDSALAGTPHSAQGCPYIEKWLAFYESKDSQHLELALLKYAPEAKAARVANDYIPIVTRRVHQATVGWVKTGQLTGVPDELAKQVSAGGMFDSVGGFFSAVGSSVLGFLAGSPKKEETAHSPIARKARDGAGAPSQDAGAVQAQLGTGRSLEPGVASQMSSAFRYDFSGVRVHTDGRAASLSSQLNARAFTIGRDVAFGAGEYNPGTPVGDALLAHELAHVVQQGGGNGATSAPMTKTADQSSQSSQLEADADAAAIHAVTSVWIGAKNNLAAVGANAVPRLRSGLRLQRCGASQKATKTPVTKTAAQPGESPTKPSPAGGTPCPDSVHIGGTKSFNHSMLPEADKGRIRTALGVVSLMEVGPGPDHSGHCMKETLSGKSDCPPSVFTNKEGANVGACGRPPKCLGIHQYAPKSMGFGLTHSSFVDSATSFIDLHITTNPHSLLGDSDPNECTETCEQIYSCDREKPATGRFRITRNFKKDKYKMPDGTVVPITTGTAKKENA